MAGQGLAEGLASAFCWLLRGADVMSQSTRTIRGAVMAGLVLALLSVENRASAKDVCEELLGLGAKPTPMAGVR